jgi:hypothetical protein
MQIKFIQLEIGQRFLFEGHAYTKSTPLMARSETNGQERFVPRSAVVETEERTAPPSAAPTPPLQRVEVQQAWQQFQGHCSAALARLDEDGDKDLEALRRELAAARTEFEERLGLGAHPE